VDDLAAGAGARSRHLGGAGPRSTHGVGVGREPSWVNSLLIGWRTFWLPVAPWCQNPPVTAGNHRQLSRLRIRKAPANPPNRSPNRHRLKIVVSPVRVRVSPLPKIPANRGVLLVLARDFAACGARASSPGPFRGQNPSAGMSERAPCSSRACAQAGRTRCRATARWAARPRRTRPGHLRVGMPDMAHHPLDVEGPRTRVARSRTRAAGGMSAEATRVVARTPKQYRDVSYVAWRAALPS
jgi:hypothetical protein